jgi:limonene-1,2-epoxide hydrolase
VSAEQVVKDFIAAIERKDLDAALEHMAEDAVYDNVPMAAVTGHDGVKQVLGPFLAGADAVEFRVDRFQMGDRWLELPVMGVFEVAGGRITLWRDYFDLATLTNQMQA